DVGPAERAKHHAPPAVAAAAVSIAVLRFVSTSSGITSRQPAAAPARSQAYSQPTGPPLLVSASVTATPEQKNGTPSTVTSTASGRISESRASVSGGIGTVSVTRCDSATEAAIASAARGSARCAPAPRYASPLRNTYTAPDAMPSIASV